MLLSVVAPPPVLHVDRQGELGVTARPWLRGAAPKSRMADAKKTVLRLVIVVVAGHSFGAGDGSVMRRMGRWRTRYVEEYAGSSPRFKLCGSVMRASVTPGPTHEHGGVIGGRGSVRRR
jgi:hypothetical protein